MLFSALPPTPSVRSRRYPREVRPDVCRRLWRARAGGMSRHLGLTNAACRSRVSPSVLAASIRRGRLGRERAGGKRSRAPWGAVASAASVSAHSTKLRGVARSKTRRAGLPGRARAPQPRAPLVGIGRVRLHRIRLAHPLTGPRRSVSGREPDALLTRETGHSWRFVAQLWPLAPTPSELPWASTPSALHLVRSARPEGPQRLSGLLRQADGATRS